MRARNGKTLFLGPGAKQSHGCVDECCSDPGSYICRYCWVSQNKKSCYKKLSLKKCRRCPPNRPISTELKSPLLSFVSRPYYPRGTCTNHVNRILGNFDPLPLWRHFYLIAVIKCCGHLSNPFPLICPRGLYNPLAAVSTYTKALVGTVYETQSGIF